LSGESPNNDGLCLGSIEEFVRLSSIDDEGSIAGRGVGVPIVAFPPLTGVLHCSSPGDKLSGDREGNEVKDLSEGL
jgi:hypothetical protein